MQCENAAVIQKEACRSEVFRKYVLQRWLSETMQNAIQVA